MRECELADKMNFRYGIFMICWCLIVLYGEVMAIL
jgi:hypothetical protein